MGIAQHEIDRAKQVVLAIVNQSAGDTIVGKVRLFKAFYFAHLFYARENASYLTEWPIVKMPNGPGIGGFENLLKELVEGGAIKADEKKKGPFIEKRFRSTGKPLTCEGLEHEAIAAIKRAATFVAQKSAAELSEITHEYSKSWNYAKNGDVLSIYVDLLSDEEYHARKHSAEQRRSQIDQAFA